MADNFNLKVYLKKNTLLNENIGGYVDIKPVKEEMGTAMGETLDSLEQEAQKIYDDILEERGGDPMELASMTEDEALDTVKAYGHKGKTALKIAEYLLNLAENF